MIVSNSRRVSGVLVALLLTACGAPAAQTPAVAPSSAPSTAAADLSGIKTYLVDASKALKTDTATLKELSDRYYDLAKASNFDYAALWSNQSDAVRQVLQQAKNVWIAASPSYEKMEGIVAGVPSLAEYDVILDAGTPASDDPENAVPFDLTLPDGKVLPKPGNLFGVTEGTLFGTVPDYVVAQIEPDLDGNGRRDFGEVLPEANVFKAGAGALDQYAADLLKAAQAWQPTEAEAFNALVANVPTVSNFFDSWKTSRFVAGEQSTQRDFAAISRLSDISDNVSSWQVMYRSLSPMVQTVDAMQDAQIRDGLDNLKSFVSKLYSDEQGGKRFTAEEADALGGEAQNRATAIAGQISQVAARLNITIQE